MQQAEGHSAGLLRVGGSASLYPACVSHSIESRASFSRLDQSEMGSVSKEGGVREVQQRGRGQRGAATSSLLPSRHQDHQIHAVLPLRCPSPAAPRALVTRGPASSGPRPWPRPRSAPLPLCSVPSAVLGSKPGAAWPHVTAWKGGGGTRGGTGREGSGGGAEQEHITPDSTRRSAGATRASSPEGDGLRCRCPGECSEPRGCRDRDAAASEQPLAMGGGFRRGWAAAESELLGQRTSPQGASQSPGPGRPPLTFLLSSETRANRSAD